MTEQDVLDAMAAVEATAQDSGSTARTDLGDDESGVVIYSVSGEPAQRIDVSGIHPSTVSI